jgi:small subunit ribosomal protein S1
MKALEPDPWGAIAEKFPAWKVVEGRLTRVSDFGAFLELAPGIEGLLHEEELPRGALPHLEEAARTHRRMAVVVLEVDSRRRRIALAPAPAGLEPGQEVSRVAFRRGGVVTGRVEQTTPDGVLVRFGPGQLGLIQPFETGTPRGSDLSAEFPRGGAVTAEVLSVEPGGRRAYLSRKRALRREERAEVERHMKSQEEMRFPTLGDLLRQAQSKPPR